MLLNLLQYIKSFSACYCLCLGRDVMGGHINNINNSGNKSSIKTIGNPIPIAGLQSAAVLLSACHDCHYQCQIAFQL